MKAKDLNKGQRYKVVKWRDHPVMKDWVLKHIRIDRAGNVFGEINCQVFPAVNPETEVELVEQ